MNKAFTPIEVGFNTGNALLALSSLYSNYVEPVREMVQNALDKMAKRIIIRIHVPRAMITCADDGLGAGHIEIAKKFENICLSLNADNPSTIGEKGIGNLAGLAIAQKYELIVKDMTDPSDPFRVYQLDQDMLIGQKKVNLTPETLPGKELGREFSFSTSAVVRLRGVSEIALRRLSNLDLICETLSNSFGSVIQQRNVDIRIELKPKHGPGVVKRVQPMTFRGAKLGSKKYQTPRGEILFDFYFSSKRQEKALVLVEHKKLFSFPAENLIRRGQLSAEVEEILETGFFEGMIQVSFCTINEQRDAFRDGGSYGQELLAFTTAVNKYFSEVLKPIAKQVKEENRQEQYRQIGEDVLKKLGRFLQKQSDLIPERIKTFLGYGPRVETNSVTLGVEINIPTERKKKETRIVDPKPQVDRPAKEEVIDGVTDKPDRVTKKRLLSIHFVAPGDEEKSFNWHSRLTREGAIQINTENRDFIEASRLGRTKLEQHVMVLVLKELTCANLEDHVSKNFNDSFEDVFMRLWGAFLV